MTHLVENARKLLEECPLVFGDEAQIQALQTLRAAAEIDEVIRQCPHYASWEMSLEPCCARMQYYSAVYRDLFNERMRLAYPSFGRKAAWA